MKVGHGIHNNLLTLYYDIAMVLMPTSEAVMHLLATNDNMD